MYTAALVSSHTGGMGKVKPLVLVMYQILGFLLTVKTQA